MSIRHDVTVHCDGCYVWVHVDGRDLTRMGWKRYREGDDDGPLTGSYPGHLQHLCPACVADPSGWAADVR